MSSASTKDVSFLAFLIQLEYLEQNSVSEFKLKGLADTKLFEALIDNKLLNEQMLKKLQVEYTKIPQIHITKIDHDSKKLPENLARTYTAVLVEDLPEKAIVALKNPLNRQAQHIIRMQFDKSVEFCLAEEEILIRTVERLYRQTHKASSYAESAMDLVKSHNIYQLKSFDIIKDTSSSNVASMLDSILQDALNLETSDIHIEADTKEVAVRYRLSGSLVKQVRFSPDIKDIFMRHVIARSGGDISEMRLPQDTSFEYKYKGDTISIRVSALYSLTGYSIVMRLLMPANSYFDLEATVDSPEVYGALKDMLDASNGMLIVTGPTSSGKTTLLYNALMYVAQRNRKILTAEDPVEVELPDITQVQVVPEIGLDYDEVIKTALRQNPDALMLGEVRDGETASMAMRAAITGIMVAVTLHTKNVTSTVLRLTDLGVSLALIATGVKLIVAARLCRKLCKNCCKEHKLNSDEMQKLEKMISAEELKKGKYYCAVGCDDCLDTGYKGLHGVYECLVFNTPIVHALSSGDFDKFRESAFSQIKGNTLGDNVIKLWQEGITSYEEVTKLVFNT